MDKQIKDRLNEIDGILDTLSYTAPDTLNKLGLIIDELKGYLDVNNPDKEKRVAIEKLLKKIGKIQRKCPKVKTPWEIAPDFP